MALLREHFEFGLIAGGILYIILFAIASYFHLFGNFYIWLISFIVGFIAMIAGSLLPDMDAPRSPVHDTIFAFFTILLAVVMQPFMGYMSLIISPFVSVFVDRNYLPAHRGFIHTVEAGILFGTLVSGSLYFLLVKNLALCLWCGFSLSLGHLLHLTKDSLPSS